MKTLFDICTPRPDVQKGNLRDSDLAADLAQVISGTAPDEYKKPELFFANTYPTKGLKDLLKNVCQRLSGQGGAVSSVFRLDTQYGGGKTHSLIALTHAANGMKGVAGVEEIDTVMKLGMAHPMGPLQLADFIGLDVCLSILNVLYIGFGNQKYAPCPLLVNMVTAGKLGIKSGEGFYTYTVGSKDVVVSKSFN